MPAPACTSITWFWLLLKRTTLGVANHHFRPWPPAQRHWRDASGSLGRVRQFVGFHRPLTLDWHTTSFKAALPNLSPRELQPSGWQSGRRRGLDALDARRRACTTTCCRQPRVLSPSHDPGRVDSSLFYGQELRSARISTELFPRHQQCPRRASPASTRRRAHPAHRGARPWPPAATRDPAVRSVHRQTPGQAAP